MPLGNQKNKLTSVVIGNSVRKIGEAAFKDNQLTSLLLVNLLEKLVIVLFKIMN